MVVNVDLVRKEYKKVEDRLYRLRSNFGYSTVRNQAFKRLEERARRLSKIVLQMESSWGKRK